LKGQAIKQAVLPDIVWLMSLIVLDCFIKTVSP